MSEIKHKYSVIQTNYNKPSDRFLTAGYGNPAEIRGVFELIDWAAEDGVVDGLELMFVDAEEDAASTWLGISDSNKQEVKAAMDDAGLEIAAVLPVVWGHWTQALGTIGASDPQTRREALDLCKRAMDVAAAVGCPYIGIWPGHDGYDYYFEADYQKQWEWWVEGMRELAEHNPQINIGLEPKPDEPRAYSFISTVPKTLLLLEDIDKENVGVCLDIGHSLYGHENLGEVIAHMQMRGKKLFHMHMNDNYNSADLDMIFGSVHWLEMIEMFYWLRRTGFDGFMSIDLFAYRVDPRRAINEGVRWMQTMDQLIDEIGLEKMGALIEQGDPVETLAFFRQTVFDNR